MLEPPSEPDERDWIGVTDQTLPVERALTWASQSSCGAVVTFSGTVRDHSDGRPGVTALEYEVYPEQAVRRLRHVAEAARNRWPMVGRLVLLHRVGAPPCRGDLRRRRGIDTPPAEAFAAAEYCIDTLKRSVPIWKRETWAGGTDWSTCSHDIEEVGA